MALNQNLFILALDLATTTGFAKGFMQGEPFYGSLRFGKAEASDNAVFAAALRWATGFLAEAPRPDLIVLERLLPPMIVQGKTQTKTYERLAGLHAVIRSVAFELGVYRIETVPVSKIRSHFIGASNLPGEEAKLSVMRQCRKMGWKPASDDEGDALAVWHYACASIDPKLAIQVSPLFRPGLAIWPE
jgi:hypothetical protein